MIEDISHHAFYNSDDLALFQRIINDALASCERYDGKAELVLKVGLAEAIFKFAETGERDYATLMSRALPQ